MVCFWLSLRFRLVFYATRGLDIKEGLERSGPRQNYTRDEIIGFVGLTWTRPGGLRYERGMYCAWMSQAGISNFTQQFASKCAD